MIIAGAYATRVLPFSLVEIAALAVAGAVWLFLAVFFRDPEREVGEGIVSAADGRVSAIEREGDRVRISVFMNVTNVHVNRFPLTAKVEAVDDAGSGFRPAYGRDAAENVRRRYALESALGPVEVVQITGILARRLVSFVKPGVLGHKGDRFGMIVFGSRVDVVLPGSRVELAVTVGDPVRAGVTTIARERA